MPYEFIGKEVDIRTTEKCIEVFYHNNRIVSHVKKERSLNPIYMPEHMPENHRKYLACNTEAFLEWGALNSRKACTFQSEYSLGMFETNENYKKHK